MAEIILITGGARSGKSRYAQTRAEALPGVRAYIATCPVLDSEMGDRIKRHQKDRHGLGWQTIEETVDLAGLLATEDGFDLVLIDCLTLWINNLLYTEGTIPSLNEDRISTLCHELIAVCRQRTGTVIMVTNEVGSGIVPENQVARRYRDLVGRCNQVIAAAADELVLVVCGQSLKIKGE
ncbi:MAG: bifunctional adenosylcobinamide kinase/adenosylcobinamide-phosphate guanylyltransferase [Proteobacteria bacterium]|nr:bifunctional adenosylcobinamide kinase/adenosylcobinamide-phosphate guanylyltransferase [Pseudomonadota bacterium]MBU1715042.1 bifunctional adenosylcobinamide kinase/adenosylcobinamide-phosphate guanylyltransferase [Pseudomonadota bacterium]